MVTITGSGFGTDTTLVTVDIWGIKCDIYKMEDTEIVCITGELPKDFVLENITNTVLRYPGKSCIYYHEIILELCGCCISFSISTSCNYI